ncbi:MAG: YggS family pyridoxal phosphate-dependent enzyme [Flavobacteriales bacterium]
MSGASEVEVRLTAVRGDVVEAGRKAGREVVLVAVSKTKPDEDLMAAYEAGQRDFGENRVQELVGKAERLPKDIRWHMIGHVQTNKIKDFLPFVHLVHGVDRVKVLDVLEREAAKLGRTVDVLLQMHVAEEDTKFGFSGDELRALADEATWEAYPHLCPVGLMGMATFTDDTDQVRREFAQLAALHREVGPALSEVAESRGGTWGVLSMGMSGDWNVAVEEGSTMVRVGSSIFGHRNVPSP